MSGFIRLIQMTSTVKLSNGKLMPLVGLGTYARKADPGQCRQAVEWAIEAGYKSIDTASCYNNEEEVGEGINNMINKGIVNREDIFVITKLWSDMHARGDVIPALKSSLQRLKLNYVDLYLMHWPFSVNEKGEDTHIDYLETWQAMEEAVGLGLTKSIGVSNFNIKQLTRLLKAASVKPVCNEFEINPTLTQHELVDFCKQNSVVPLAYTPLGLLSEARPEFIGIDTIKTDPKLEEIAKKHGKTKAQIVLKYLLQRGAPVVPKSYTKTRIIENISLFDFQLSEAEMDVVDGFNINHRCVPAKFAAHVDNYPF